MGRQEHRIERRLVAIFAADVAGFSRLMEQDEVGTLRSLIAHRAIMDQLIAEHGGRVANTAGDSVLAEFPSAVDAVHCAVDAQHALSQASRDIPEVRRLQFRIGVHVGDVMVRGGDLLGDGVNIAARVQALARPGGICVSGAAHAFVRKALALEFDDLGPQKVVALVCASLRINLRLDSLGSDSLHLKTLRNLGAPLSANPFATRKIVFPPGASLPYRTMNAEFCRILA